jgi:hypothetical protein
MIFTEQQQKALKHIKMVYENDEVDEDENYNH